MALPCLESPNMGRNARKRNSNSLISHVVRWCFLGNVQSGLSCISVFHKAVGGAIAGEGRQGGVETGGRKAHQTMAGN